MREKPRHTPPVTHPRSHGAIDAQTPRRLASWPDPIVKPPFSLGAGVAIVKEKLDRIAPSHATPSAIAAVAVTLHGVGVTHSRGRFREEGFSLREAVEVALEWVHTDLGDVETMLLVTGLNDREGEPADAPKRQTFQTFGHYEGWSVMVLPAARQAIGIFRNRAAKDLAPTWVWHRLAGELLLPHDEMVVT